MQELKDLHGADKLQPYKYRLWAEMIVRQLFMDNKVKRISEYFQLITNRRVLKLNYIIYRRGLQIV